MYQPEPRFQPTYQRWDETLGEYYDRLDREEREFNERHREEQEESQRKFDREMIEANGEEYPGQYRGF